MITRKAIATAFECILTQDNLKSVTVFCSAKKIPLMKTERVTVTRSGAHGFYCRVGRMNYQHRHFIKKERFAERKTLPKILFRYYPAKKGAKKK
jgi:hypothetical protein